MATKKKAPKKSNPKKVTPTLKEQLIELLNGPEFTRDELCDRLDLAPNKLNDLFRQLHEMGIETESIDGCFTIKREDQIGPEDKEYKHKLTSGIHRVALISDTHLGSHHQQLTFLKDFYHRAAELGVKRFYHAGDLCAGDGKIYQGQANEIFVHGLDAAVQYVAGNYPKVEGTTTYFITGNHDLAWFKRGGVDVGKAIERERSDLVYLGQAGAYINLTDEVRLYLHHPAGGKAYALSYKIQKFIEAMSYEQRPQILASGHLHTMAYFNYLNMDAFMVPCFESQNTYLKRLGLHPCIGGWILELEIDGKFIRRIGMDRIEYHTPILNDF